MVTGDDDLQFVPVQGVGLQALHRRQAQKATVHRAVDDPALDLIVEVAGNNFKLDVRVHLPEALEDTGQPLGGHAGEGGDLHQSAVHVLQPLYCLHERMVGGAQLFDLGQYRTAVRPTPPRLRLNSFTPSSFSSELMAWLMPDWVKFMASAALEKLPQETVFRKT